ncbi:MAG: hemin receptor [Alphaproteobacteria bacterium]|nr:hemin receptor [Alphaproteobacteria bacterium]
MTPEQVKLVQESFKLVAPIADTAADIFYDRLFATAPQVRAMFPQEMKDQKKKLMQMIGTAVTNLHQVDKIADAVAKLGARHVKYGVKDEHYDIVGAALLFTLKQGLGDKFTPDTQAAWTATYGLLAGVMKDAAKNGG